MVEHSSLKARVGGHDADYFHPQPCRELQGTITTDPSVKTSPDLLIPDHRGPSAVVLPSLSILCHFNLCRSKLGHKSHGGALADFQIECWQHMLRFRKLQFSKLKKRPIGKVYCSFSWPSQEVVRTSSICFRAESRLGQSESPRDYRYGR